MDGARLSSEDRPILLWLGGVVGRKMTLAAGGRFPAKGGARAFSYPIPVRRQRLRTLDASVVVSFPAGGTNFVPFFCFRHIRAILLACLPSLGERQV